MATLKLALDKLRGKNAHVDPHADITCFGNFILLNSGSGNYQKIISPFSLNNLNGVEEVDNNLHTDNAHHNLQLLSLKAV